MFFNSGAKIAFFMKGKCLLLGLFSNENEETKKYVFLHL